MRGRGMAAPLACWLIPLPCPPSSAILQLPIDDSLGNAHTFHYTQVCTWTGAGRRDDQERRLLQYTSVFDVGNCVNRVTPPNPLHTHARRHARTPPACSQPPSHPATHTPIHTHPPTRPQCTIYKTMEGNADVWAYDKRFHTSMEESLKVPPIEQPPAFQVGAGGDAGRRAGNVGRIGVGLSGSAVRWMTSRRETEMHQVWAGMAGCAAGSAE